MTVFQAQEQELMHLVKLSLNGCRHSAHRQQEEWSGEKGHSKL